MSCEYCRGTRSLINQRDTLSRKGDFYPGLEVYLEKNVLYIVAVPDTYEPGYLEASVKINFCPMCGRLLPGKGTDA
jgi:hypothetical protein